MDILYLVDHLENLVTNSKKMPLVNQIMLKESDILTIIDQMRTSIPGEVKQARRILQEHEEILARAREEAASVLSNAREEAERILSREGLLRAAQERGQEIIRRANEQAQLNIRRAEEHTDQLQLEADSYALETLQNLRAHLLTLETEIERTVMSIERGIESLDGAQDPISTRAGQEQQGEGSPHPPPRRASPAADSTHTNSHTFQN